MTYQRSPGAGVVVERCTKGCGVSWVIPYQKGKGRSKVDTNNVLHRAVERLLQWWNLEIIVDNFEKIKKSSS